MLPSFHGRHRRICSSGARTTCGHVVTGNLRGHRHLVAAATIRSKVLRCLAYRPHLRKQPADLGVSSEPRPIRFTCDWHGQFVFKRSPSFVMETATGAFHVLASPPTRLARMGHRTAPKFARDPHRPVPVLNDWDSKFNCQFRRRLRRYHLARHTDSGRKARVRTKSGERWIYSAVYPIDSHQWRERHSKNGPHQAPEHCND